MTLADYLGTLRRYWLFILLVSIGCTAAAFAYSKLQTPEYEATASLTVRNPSQDLTLLGRGALSFDTPLQLASAHLPQVTRSAVLQAARSDVDENLTVDDIDSALEVLVDPNSYLVEITASSSDPREAALMANAVAKADARLSGAEARQSYAAAAERLRDRISELNPSERGVNKAVYIDRIASLESLSSVARPVRLNEPAAVPATPATPRTVRNTIAAGIFGLLLGIALALGRQLLDRRLREPADVEREFDLPVVARIRPEALGHTGSSRDAKLKKLGPLDQIEAESFRMLRENVRYLSVDKDLRSFAVTSAIPEEGKSTVAACLAMANAAAGTRTLLLDCDLRRRVLADRLGIAEVPGLSDYLAGRAKPEEVLRTVPVPNGPATNGSGPLSLVVITAGTTPPQPADLLRSERFAEFLGQIRRAYELVIIDCPPLLPVADTREIIPHVDAVLNCVRLNWTNHDQAQAAREALDQLPERPTGLVLTGLVQRSKDYHYSYYYRAADAAPRFNRVFRRRRASNDASEEAHVGAGADATRDAPGT